MRDVGCAVLAAGAGVRFGAPGDKLVVSYLGRPLLQHAIDAACASSALTCSVIVGAAVDKVCSRIDAGRASVFVNAGWKEGLAAAIRSAIHVHAHASACILMLGDQPNVRPADIDALIATHGRHPRSIVALRCGAVWGAPILFPASDFARLSTLRGDAGAKAFVKMQSGRVLFVEAASEQAFADVDEPADLTLPNERRTHRTRRSRVRR